MLGDPYPPNGDKVAVVFPKKNPDGTLTIPRATVLDDNAFHQGGGYGANFAVSAQDKTWIVWGSRSQTFVAVAAGGTHSLGLKRDGSIVAWGRNNYGQLNGVPTWIIEYDHLTETFSDPVFLGYAGDNPNNNHSIPGIAIDGNGTLHVVLGSHNRRFKYTSSTAPMDISGWSALEFLGAPKDGDLEIDPDCPKITLNGVSSFCDQYTYVSLLADRENTLHLVSRWTGLNYLHRISYLRKPWGQLWEPRKDLVLPFVPARTAYGHWYHKLSIDRCGRPFLSYAYYGNYLTKLEADAYGTKWPSDGIYPLDGCVPDPAPTPNWTSGSSRLGAIGLLTAEETILESLNDI